MSSRNWVLPGLNRTISVGVTAADWRNLSQSLHALDTGSEWLHLDVMDGQFCPKLTLGAWAIEALPENAIVDAHVMTKSPVDCAKELVKRGVHIVTLQYEALSDPVQAFSQLEHEHVRYRQQSRPLIRGISLCPSTHLDVLNGILPDVELIQLLTLDPRTGEKLDTKSFIGRVAKLKARLDETGYTPLISVDGSMSLDIAKASVSEGAQVIVSGSALFRGQGLGDNLAVWRKYLYC